MCVDNSMVMHPNDKYFEKQCQDLDFGLASLNDEMKEQTDLGEAISIYLKGYNQAKDLATYCGNNFSNENGLFPGNVSPDDYLSGTLIGSDIDSIIDYIDQNDTRAYSVSVHGERDPYIDSEDIKDFNKEHDNELNLKNVKNDFDMAVTKIGKVLPELY